MNANLLDDAVAMGKFNPFNLGRDNTEAELAALRDPGVRRGESEVLSVDFNISGELFNLPAGTVSSMLAVNSVKRTYSINRRLMRSITRLSA